VQHILIANGVNLDLLGKREPSIYGHKNLSELENYITNEIDKLTQALNILPPKISFYQTNSETDYLNKLSNHPYDAIIVNPGAWSHTSIALADRLVALNIPYIEVHLSNLSRREDYRKKSFLSKHAQGVIYGLGFDSYLAAIFCILKNLTVD
jgi:3-dehydroquinate dehydratase II